MKSESEVAKGDKGSIDTEQSQGLSADEFSAKVNESQPRSILFPRERFDGG